MHKKFYAKVRLYNTYIWTEIIIEPIVKIPKNKPVIEALQFNPINKHKCKQCKKTFSRKSSLERHLKNICKIKNSLINDDINEDSLGLSTSSQKPTKYL